MNFDLQLFQSLMQEDLADQAYRLKLEARAKALEAELKAIDIALCAFNSGENKAELYVAKCLAESMEELKKELNDKKENSYESPLPFHTAHDSINP